MQLRDRATHPSDADVTSTGLAASGRTALWNETVLGSQSEALCVTYAYVIDRATEKLIGRRLKDNADTEMLCKGTQSDLKLSFVNGFDVVQALRRERAPNTVSLVIATAFVLLMLAWAWRVIRKA